MFDDSPERVLYQKKVEIRGKELENVLEYMINLPDKGLTIHNAVQYNRAT